MSSQLAYVIVTPYSLYKSRTGGILSRLITRTGLDLAGLRMFAPSAELVKEYADTIVSARFFPPQTYRDHCCSVIPQTGELDGFMVVKKAAKDT